ncbi:MAG: metallophosphoesterase family protein, partial [Pseudonocardia sp.]|nr:metallophosphoesterase family protein [Pseudonocardia sp.]
MRYGLLSDIHANLPAFTAAVRCLSEHGVDRWLCAGDVIDYGPQPNECVAELAALDPVCIAGNHELVVLGELSSERYSGRALESLRWTRTVLTDDSRRYLAGLPRTAELPGVLMAHGSLTDPNEYIRRDDQAEAQLDRLAAEHHEARVLVLGHTHRAWLYRHGVGTVGGPPAAATALDRDTRYLVNPGSVGQSRQREPRPLARFALLEVPETGEARVRFFAIGYDYRAVRTALRRARLPADSVHVHPGTLATVRRR